MEKIFAKLLNLIEEGDIQCKKLDDNTYCLYIAKEDVNEIEKIKEDLDKLNDEIFEATVPYFRHDCPKEFEILSSLSEDEPDKEVVKVYPIFKEYYNKTRNKMINDLVNEISTLEVFIKEQSEKLNELKSKLKQY